MSLLQSVYCQAGMANPVVATLKYLNRARLLDHPGAGLNEEVSPVYRDQFYRAVRECLRAVDGLEVDRCVLPRQPDEYAGTPSCVAFYDASSVCCAYVIFLCWERLDLKGHHVAQILARNYLIPPSVQAMPVLEMLSLQITALAIHNLAAVPGFPVSTKDVQYCGDSRVTQLAARKNPCLYPKNLAHKIDKIQGLLDTNKQLKWVPSRYNYSDLGSRHSSCANQIQSEAWLRGGWL